MNEEERKERIQAFITEMRDEGLVCATFAFATGDDNETLLIAIGHPDHLAGAAVNVINTTQNDSYTKMELYATRYRALSASIAGPSPKMSVSLHSASNDWVRMKDQPMLNAVLDAL